jgi:hypothetical protein
LLIQVVSSPVSRWCWVGAISCPSLLLSLVFALPFGPTIKPHSNPVENPHLASSENTSVSSLISFLFFCLPHCSSPPLNFYFSTYLCFATSQKALPPTSSFILPSSKYKLATCRAPRKSPLYFYSTSPRSPCISAQLPGSCSAGISSPKCSDILQILEEICQ